jgi:PPOX class probable F420-dependent enzyme
MSPTTGGKVGFVNVPSRARFILLTTYRRTGVPVPTPVWFAPSPQGLYVVTHATSGKLKRIRATPAMVVAPCRSRGQPTGPERAATAIVVSGGERRQAARAISRRYLFVPSALIEWEMRRRGGGRPAVYLELTVAT